MPEDAFLRRISATDMIGQKTPGELAVSPDGSTIAFTLSEVDFSRSEVRTQIHRCPEPEGPGVKGRARQITQGPDDATHPEWSPDGRSLAFLGHRPQPNDDDEDRNDHGRRPRQVHELVGGAGEARRVTDMPEGVETFRYWPDGSGIVSLCRAVRPAAETSWRRHRHDSYDDAHVVNEEIPRLEIWRHPFEGHKTRIVPASRGIDDFDLSPDGRLIAYATNHTGRPEDIDRGEIILREIDGGREQLLTSGRGGSESQPRFTADGRFVLFHGWSDPALAFSRQELFAVDVAAALEGSRPEPVPLLLEIDRDLEEFVPLPDGRVAALVAWGLESRLVLIDPSTGLHELLAVEGKTLSHLAAARDTGRLAAVIEDGASLPEVGFIDPAGSRIETASELHEDPKEWRLSRRQRVAWDSGGLRHEGLVLAPVRPGHSDKGDPPPLVTWVHGGPHWRVQDTLRVYEAEVLVGEGYAVFLPQYRGSSGHGEAYGIANRGDLGGADARDIIDGIDHVVGLGLGDPARLALAGASYGGYMTNWLLATTNRFRAGISMAGIFDLAQDYSTSDYSSWELHYLGYPPWEKPELYRERSPLTHASAIEAPILILHGLEDDNSFFTNSKGLYRALTALGRTAELVLYPREGHGLFEPSHRVDALHRMLEWLNRHVNADRGGRSIHVGGRSVEAEGLRLTPLGHFTRREYSGVRPGHGRVFLEVAVLLEALDAAADLVRILPSGTSSDLVLVDELGDLHRPIGVPLDVHDQPVLFAGRGALEAWRTEEGIAPSLPVAVVFEIPSWPGQYQLRVTDLPPIVLDVLPEPEDDGDDHSEAGR